MITLTLFYATNRNHLGRDRWRPTGYGTRFSEDGLENLRFGRLKLEAEEEKIDAALAKAPKEGEELADYLSKRAKSALIEAYQETLAPDRAEAAQPDLKLGSQAMFAEVKALMQAKTDVLVYIHGYNVSWREAVGAALALQVKLNRSQLGDPDQSVQVILFSWPSDGRSFPFASYRSDRAEAAASGSAVGRGFLKLRDYLAALRDRTKAGEALCDQDIHVLCHSMGNYVLQEALRRMQEHMPSRALPRIFEHIFLCSADVDDTALEPHQPLSRLHELARSVSIYHNREDKALVISDFTKGNPDRLGSAGAARPHLLHQKVNQIDCTPIVGGLAEHSYYLSGNTNADVRQSIDGVPHADPSRLRKADSNRANVWAMA